jgi:hypothetical protein
MTPAMTTAVMTTTTAPPESVPSARKGPRWLPPLILIVLLAVVAMSVTLMSRDPQGNTEHLDPANPGYSGAQGLAHVLTNHGVEVIVVRSQAELLNETVGLNTTMVITRTDQLSERTAGMALARARSAASLILLEPDPEIIKGMSLPVDSHPADLTDVTADCTGTEVGKELRLAQAGRAYTQTGNGPAATVCFPDVKDGGGAMVRLAPAQGRPPVTLLGDTSLISNGAILDSDNAAIALRLFGQSDRLVWYVPTVADISVAESTSRSIAPSWFQPGLALTTSAVVFLCLWRGRRLGRLVAEPLPVIVRAVETTESRGRMYRKSRDRARALAVLQLATRRRLASYLGLSESTSVSSVAAAAAAISGRDYHDVLALLNSPAAQDDSSLLKLANTLVSLEKEVRGT